MAGLGRLGLNLVRGSKMFLEPQLFQESANIQARPHVQKAPWSLRKLQQKGTAQGETLKHVCFNLTNPIGLKVEHGIVDPSKRDPQRAANWLSYDNS